MKDYVESIISLAVHGGTDPYLAHQMARVGFGAGGDPDRAAQLAAAAADRNQVGRSQSRLTVFNAQTPLRTINAPL
jgi:hypothetical protein